MSGCILVDTCNSKSIGGKAQVYEMRRSTLVDVWTAQLDGSGVQRGFAKSSKMAY